MARRDLIVVGASAGGVEALRTLCAHLPKDLAAAVVVVLHVPPSARSVLPAILDRAGSLRAHHARHLETLTHGTIFVAPPDHHIFIDHNRIRVTRGPRVNGHRPAIDPLFRSAAMSAGARAIGAVLSGTLDDGTLGLGVIAQAGGLPFVQDPKQAAYPAMPSNALSHVPSARALSLELLADAIVKATGEELPDAPGREGSAMATSDDDFERQPTGEPVDGAPSGFTCPECNGALWELEDRGLVRYQCHVGHGYTSRALLAGQSTRLEEALWTAFRALKDNAALAKRLGDRAKKQGLDAAFNSYQRSYEEAIERARLIERILERGEVATRAPETPGVNGADEA